MEVGSAARAIQQAPSSFEETVPPGIKTISKNDRVLKFYLTSFHIQSIFISTFCPEPRENAATRRGDRISVPLILPPVTVQPRMLRVRLSTSSCTHPLWAAATGVQVASRHTGSRP